MSDLKEKMAKLPPGSEEFINIMVDLQKKSYDEGMLDAINIIINVIDQMQEKRGLQIMTIDEIRKVLNDGKSALISP